MKKFAYIQHHGLPSRKAHSIYVVKCSEASVGLIKESYLVTPGLNKQTNSQIRNYYDIKKSQLRIVQLESLDIRNLFFLLKWIKEHGWFLVSSWVFAIKAISWAKNNKISIIQTGDREIIFLLKIIKKRYSPKVIYDVHYDFSQNKYDGFLERKIISRVNLFTVNCQYLREKFIKLKINKSKILVLPSGYDPKHFNHLSKSQSRKKYKFPKNKFIVGFIGQFHTLGIEKGINELIKAAKNLKAKIPICIVAIGGPKNLVEKYQKLADKLKLKKDEIIIRDYISPNKVGEAISGFDVGALLYPPKGYFVEKISPMKAIEYQAANKLILATDIPSVKGILKDKAIYTPFKIKSIQKAILNIYNEKLHLKPIQYHRILTWKARQKKIFQNL
jgi:glycosyltransferase involved in cell wall biosynthesis